MKQQVNLYQPVFRKQKKIFSAVTMVKVMVVLMVGFSAIYGFGRFQLAKLEGQVASLERQRDNATTQLTRVSEEHQPVQRSALLEEQLQQAQQELERKQRELQALERRVTGGSGGFSGVFAGLGRQRLNGLWLTRIAVDETGEVHLDGHAELAQLVPRFLQKLGQEPAFRGVEFRSIRIQRTNPSTHNAFQVSTGRIDEP